MDIMFQCSQPYRITYKNPDGTTRTEESPCNGTQIEEIRSGCVQHKDIDDIDTPDGRVELISNCHHTYEDDKFQLVEYCCKTCGWHIPANNPEELLAWLRAHGMIEED